MNETIQLYKDPFTNILRLSKIVKNSLQPGDGMYDIISQIPFPEIADEEINEISKSIEQGKFTPTVFLDINYPYPYIHKLTLSVLKNDSSKNESVAAALFFSFIGWYNYYQLTHDTEYAQSLLKALISDTALVFPSIAVSSFFFLYKMLFETYGVDLHECLETLMYFFTLPLAYPPEVTALLGISLSRCIEAGSTSLNELATFVLKAIHLVVESHNGLLNGAYADDLIAKISVNIWQLQPAVFPTFSMILGCATPQNHNFLFHLISKTILNSLDKEKMKEWPKAAKTRILPDTSVYEGAFTFSDVKTFKNGFHCDEKISLPAVGDVESLVSNETKQKLELVFSVLSENCSYAPVFISSLIKNTKNAGPSFEAFALILFSIEKLKNLLKNESFGLELYKTELFDPGITVFGTQDFAEINTLRDFAFKRILREGDSSLVHVLNKVQKEPLQCAELFIRCENSIYEFSKLVIASKILLKTLRDILIFLRQANITDPEPADIETARERLYSLFLNLLDKHGPRDFIFKEPVFVQAFMLGFYEEEMWPETTGVIQNYLDDDIPHVLIFDTLIQIIMNPHFTSPNGERYMKLIIHIINAITNSITINSKIVEDLPSFNKGLILSITKLPEGNALSEKLLKQLVNYFTVLASNTVLDTDVCKPLPSIFQSVFKGNIPEYFMPLFRHLMSSNPYGSESDMFIITQPKLSMITMKVFDKTSFMVDVYELLCELMDYDDKNAVALHEGEIDSFAISILYDARQTNDYSAQQIDAILALVTKIAKLISSPTVVKQFVSLLCPLKKMVISNYQPKFLRVLYDLMMDVYKKHGLTFIFEPNEKIVKNVPALRFTNEGISFVFWISLHEAFSPKQLATFSFPEGNIIIKISNELIAASCVTATGTVKFECEIDLCFDVWYLVLINFKASNNQFVITCRINQSLFTIGKFNFPLSVSSGTASIGRDADDTGYSCEISYACLYEHIAISTYQEMVNNGPCSVPKLPAIVSFIPEAKSIDAVSEHDTTFAFALISLWKFDLIIPLFALFNFNYSDGTLFRSAPTFSTSILTKALLSSDNGLKDFTNDNKIGYISYLLTMYSADILTYELYLQFFSLFEMVKIPELREQIFTSILTNMQIWTASGEQLQILKHWSQVCVNAYPRFFTLIGFTDLLDLLRIYYWYTPSDNTVVQIAAKSKRQRPSTIEVSLCRHEIAQIIVILATRNPELIDISCIIANCFYSQDIDQIKDLLFIIELLIQKISLIKITMDNLYKIICLNSKLRNEDIAVSIFKIFSSLQMKNTISMESLAEFLSISINTLDPAILTDHFFDEINVMFSSSINELIPVLSWFGINLQKAQLVVRNISKIKATAYNKMGSIWYIWPFIFCAFTQKEDCSMMISYIISSINDMRTVCAIIDVVCSALGSEAGNIKANIFGVIADLIIERKLKISAEDSEKFVSYVLFFITHRSWLDVSPAIEYQMKINGFNEELSPKNYTKIPRLTAKDLFEAISNIKVEKMRATAGFRIDEVGRWNDTMLSKKIVEITSSKIVVSYLTTLIKHTDPKYAPKSTNLVVDYTMTNIDELFRVLRTENRNVLLKICSEITSFARKVCENKITDIFKQISMTSITSNYLKNVMTARKESHDRWIRLWSALSSDKGPWDAARSMPKKVQHMKRDNTDCYAFCPFRMRVNHNYTDHHDASYQSARFGIENVKEEPPKRKRLSSNIFNQLPDESDAASILVSQKQEDVEVPKNAGKEIINLPCKIVKPKNTKEAVFKLFENRIEILDSDEITSFYTIFHNEVNYIYLRSRFHKLTAMEIFSCKLAPIFVDFGINSLKILSKISEYIPRKVQKLGFAQNFEKRQFMEDWVNGTISNFCYLMLLNVMSGRTFNDLSQYPVFPWVVFDMEHQTLDFNNPETFRDFSKPIGAQNQRNLQKLLEVMNERCEVSFDSEAAYLYTSGPVSRLIICLYLMRIEPFSSIHIDLQSGHFDVPDRLVASIAESLSIVKNIINDNRELIPEFFFLPEFLVNDNGFDLGMKNGKPLNDIETPPWGKTPMEFIYMHRKALESNYVSEHLKDWIDLVWGYKQKGEEAKKANNLFDPKLYENVWDEYAKHNKSTEGLEDFLSMIGEIPHQLFTEPHKQRKQKTKYVLQKKEQIHLKEELLYAAYDLKSKTIIVVTKDGDVVTYSPRISQVIEMVQIQRQTFHNECYLKGFESPEKLLFASNEHGVITITSELFHGVFVIQGDTNATLLHIPQFRPVQLACSGDWFLTSGNDSTTSVFRIKTMSQQYTTQSYRNNALCSCINDTFKVQIIGVNDGSLIISSLGTGQTIQIIDLDAIPIRVAVTPQWGFILVEVVKTVGSISSQRLVLYSINGIFIREQEISWKISNWCFWTSPRGFDYMAILSPKGNISYAEVFYLNMTSIAANESIDPETISLKYLPSCGSIVCCSPNGAVSFIPYYDKEDW